MRARDLIRSTEKATRHLLLTYKTHVSSQITYFFFFQIATGFSVNDILEKAQQLFNNVLNEAETTLGSFENQSNEIFSNLLDDAKSKLNDLVPTIENEITKEFSDVANAAPKIQACLEAEKQNLSAIVDDACK